MSRKTIDLPRGLSHKAMREADEQICAKHAAGIFDDGDPNHPKHNGGINYVTGKPATIFGHETEGFLRRQYKVAS